MTEFFRFLVETNLVTAAFVIGAIALVIAIIGKFKTIIEPSPAMRFLLAVFGIILMALSISSYFVSSQTKPITVETPTHGATSAPVVQPSATVQQSVQQPTSTPSQTQQQTIYNCPIYKEKGKGLTWEIDINVLTGEIAFIDAWGFDDRSGSVFVIITGPYSSHHTIHDGAFCGGIPVNANYEPVKQQRMGYLQAGYQVINLP